MSKVFLQYSGRKHFPLTLTMPWLTVPLTWDETTGRLLEVDREDAERLADSSGVDFTILHHLTQEHKEEKAAPFDEPLLLKPPDVEDVEPSINLQCPYCNRKPYKRQDFYDRHIANKHPEQLVGRNNGNDNGE